VRVLVHQHPASGAGLLEHLVVGELGHEAMLARREDAHRGGAVRPPFAYFGGKTGMADRLVALLPPHRVYMEPFFGSGAVLFAKRPSTHEIVNDLDDAVVAFFRCLRERPEDLERACRLTPYARAEYQASDLDGPLDDLERARRFWVRVNQSFAKTAGRATGWSVTTARTQSTGGSVEGRIDRFMACARRLSTVAIEHCDAAGLVERLATPDTAIYVDPPYLFSTRNSRAKTSGASDYRCDMGAEDKHARLAEVLHQTAAAVVLSGYPSPLYDDLYGDWPTIDVHVHAHSSNAVTSGRGQRVERIWTNFEPHVGRLALGASS